MENSTIFPHYVHRLPIGEELDYAFLKLSFLLKHSYGSSDLEMQISDHLPLSIEDRYPLMMKTYRDLWGIGRSFMKKYADRYKHTDSPLRSGDIDDIVDECIFKIIGGIKRYQEERGFLAWYSTIVHHTLSTFRQKRWNKVIRFSELEKFIEGNVNLTAYTLSDYLSTNSSLTSGRGYNEYTQNPLDLLIAQEGEELTRQSILSLGELYSPIMAGIAQGISQKDIASSYHLTRETVKMRAFRARPRLEKHLLTEELAPEIRSALSRL